MDSQLHDVRRLLSEAAERAALLGEEPQDEPAGVGYFAGDGSLGLDEAIDAVAGYDGDITLFVGAGVSTEAQLPSWAALVKELLDGSAGEMAQGDRTLWTDAILAEGPLAAAAIARALKPSDTEFRRALRDALYGGRHPRDIVPGALAQQIAWLKKRLGSRLRIATANYDGLLEAALKGAGLDPVSYVRKWAEPEGRAAVWHLHGRLMRSDADTAWLSEGQLVLTEGDYARSAHATWPEDFVAESLRESLCVFVGLSMTDPNFIRWLYRHKSESSPEHIAIFVRQAAPSAKEAIREKLEEAAEARWRIAGVRPIWTNYYGEVAQLVHEIGLRATEESSEDFMARASARLENARRSLMPTSKADFQLAQASLSRLLQERVGVVRRLADALGVELDSEDLGLGLWAMDHAKGIAELWGTSEQIWLDPLAVEARPVHVGSRWVGVAAITHGVPVEQDPAVYTTRWRFIRGIPLVVDPLGRRSVVGALTLTSATPLEACPLSVAQAPPGLLSAVDQVLAQGTSDFFVE